MCSSWATNSKSWPKMSYVKRRQRAILRSPRCAIGSRLIHALQAHDLVGAIFRWFFHRLAATAGLCRNLSRKTHFPHFLFITFHSRFFLILFRCQFSVAFSASEKIQRTNDARESRTLFSAATILWIFQQSRYESTDNENIARLGVSIKLVDESDRFLCPKCGNRSNMRLQQCDTSHCCVTGMWCDVCYVARWKICLRIEFGWRYVNAAAAENVHKQLWPSG